MREGANFKAKHSTGHSAGSRAKCEQGSRGEHNKTNAQQAAPRLVSALLMAVEASVLVGIAFQAA
jgi:hypothetical protein